MRLPGLGKLVLLRSATKEQGPVNAMPENDGDSVEDRRKEYAYALFTTFLMLCAQLVESCRDMEYAYLNVNLFFVNENSPSLWPTMS